MDITSLYLDVMELIKSLLIVSGMLAFTIRVIVMLVNMVINAATGKGFNIGEK